MGGDTQAVTGQVDVQDVRALLPQDGAGLPRTTVGALVRAVVTYLRLGWARKQRGAGVYVKNWLPGYARVSADAIVQEEVALTLIEQAVARSFGYASWSHALADGDARAIDPFFELAVDAVVDGRVSQLETLLRAKPALVHDRSALPHGATLLHYVAANGVEIWRQRVPPTAARIVTVLVVSGADPFAKMSVYGGRYDVLALARSSAHVHGSFYGREAIRELEEQCRFTAS